MKIKRILTAMLFSAVLLACSAAMAVDIVDLSTEDYLNIILPDGLVLLNENPKGDGTLTLNVDTDATNWAAAVASGYSNYAQMLYQFLVPEVDGASIGVGDAYIMFFEDPELTPAEMFADIEKNSAAYYVINGVDGGVASGETNVGQRGMTENSITLGQYLPATGYLNPETMQDTRYICWYRKDTAGNWQALTPYFRLQLSVTQTRNAAFPTNGATPVPAANISTSITNGSAEVNYSRTAEVADGKVTYTLAIGDEAETTIRLPEGATHWRSPSLKGFGDSGNGDICISSTLRSDDPMRASAKTYLIFTMEDEQEKLMDAWSIDFYYQTNQTEAWPYHLPDDFTRLTVGSGTDTDRLIIRNGAAEAGYKVSFDNASARMLSEFTSEVTNNAALTGEMEVTVTQPAGAKSFRYMTKGNNHSILGPRYTTASDFDEMLNLQWDGTTDNPNLVGVHDLPSYKYSALRKIIPADVPNLAIYVPSVPTVPNYANLMVVNWYSDEAGETLLQRDFVWETITLNETPDYGWVVESEQDLPPEAGKPVKIPCVIGPGSQQAWKGNWKLLVKTYYQEGINARHYEFHLVDKDNNPVVLPVGEKVTVYLPIPEEMEGAVPSETTFRLQHYSSKFYDENDPDLEGTPVNVTMTEYGLKMEVDHFSPFILSWDAGEENPNATASQTTPPQTGDATPVWLLGALCLCSLAALAIAKRRKQA